MNIVKLLCVTLSASLGLSTLLAPIARAQGVFDINPPVIELDESNEGIAGETQVFTAQVTDDRALRDVKLYYRFSGQDAYIDLFMTRLGDTDYFSANVNTTDSETRSIEYYIQARDEGGNRVIKGFAFDPFVRFLIQPPPDPEPTAQVEPEEEPVPTEQADPAIATIETATEPVEERKSGGFNWWYVALGVLAVGVIAATVGNDDSNPQSEAPEEITVDVSIDRP